MATGTNTATNVTAGKPAIGGAIFRAPLGTSLPTSALSALPADWVCLGYCSEDGVSNSNSPESDSIKAWGGDTVLSYQTGKEDTFAFTLIEALNVNVLETIYGTAHVSGDLANGITVAATADDAEEYSWCIDMIMRNGALRRIVLPDAKVSEVGEISYSDNAAVGYAVTLAAMPDSGQATHHEYTVKPTLTLNKSTTSIVKLANETLTATTTPAGGIVSWESSDTDIATVTSGGVVAGVAVGTCVITATYATARASCVVTITAT